MPNQREVLAQCRDGSVMLTVPDEVPKCRKCKKRKVELRTNWQHLSVSDAGRAGLYHHMCSKCHDVKPVPTDAVIESIKHGEAALVTAGNRRYPCALCGRKHIASDKYYVVYLLKREKIGVALTAGKASVCLMCYSWHK